MLHGHVTPPLPASAPAPEQAPSRGAPPPSTVWCTRQFVDLLTGEVVSCTSTAWRSHRERAITVAEADSLPGVAEVHNMDAYSDGRARLRNFRWKWDPPSGDVAHGLTDQSFKLLTRCPCGGKLSGKVLHSGRGNRLKPKFLAAKQAAQQVNHRGVVCVTTPKNRRGTFVRGCTWHPGAGHTTSEAQCGDAMLPTVVATAPSESCPQTRAHPLSSVPRIGHAMQPQRCGLETNSDTENGSESDGDRLPIRSHEAPHCGGSDRSWTMQADQVSSYSGSDREQGVPPMDMFDVLLGSDERAYSSPSDHSWLWDLYSSDLYSSDSYSSMTPLGFDRAALSETGSEPTYSSSGDEYDPTAFVSTGGTWSFEDNTPPTAGSSSVMDRGGTDTWAVDVIPDPKMMAVKTNGFPTALATDIDSGGRRVSKRFAVAVLGTVAVISVFLLSRHATTAGPSKPTWDDGLGPAVPSVQCGRTIEEYMWDIDDACCGQLYGDPMCSSSLGATESNGHSLHICNDLCAMTVGALWEQCILPEYQRPGQSTATPLWIFEPVVEKCKQPRQQRLECVDDDSLIDPFLPKFMSLETLETTLHISDSSAPSLCEEIRSGLITCEDVSSTAQTETDGYSIYPQANRHNAHGWYDNIAGGFSCCESCPPYWPRRALRRSAHGSGDVRVLPPPDVASLFQPEILNDEQAFKAIVSKLEERDRVDDSIVSPVGSPVAPRPSVRDWKPRSFPTGISTNSTYGRASETANTMEVEEWSHNTTLDALPVPGARETDDDVSVKSDDSGFLRTLKRP
jgi:hypothetical protein